MIGTAEGVSAPSAGYLAGMTDDVMSRCAVCGHRVYVGAGEPCPEHANDDTGEPCAGAGKPTK